MKHKNIPILFILIVSTFACQTLAPQTDPTAIYVQPQNNGIPRTEADVPRIEVHAAKAALDSGQAILVDVRSVDQYAKGHAAGAISIPLEKFEVSIDKLSLEKSQWIITYCT